MNATIDLRAAVTALLAEAPRHPLRPPAPPKPELVFVSTGVWLRRRARPPVTLH